MCMFMARMGPVSCPTAMVSTSVRRASPAYLACVDVFFPTSACLIALVMVVGRRVPGSCHTAWYVTLQHGGGVRAVPQRSRAGSVVMACVYLGPPLTGMRLARGTIYGVWRSVGVRGVWERLSRARSGPVLGAIGHI